VANSTIINFDMEMMLGGLHCQKMGLISGNLPPKNAGYQDTQERNFDCDKLMLINIDFLLG
jgi:hypothetical protein